MEKLAYSVEELQQLLGISRNLAYNMIRRGELPSIRLGRRVAIPRQAVEQLLAGATKEAA